jgi:hypothetical protein
MQATWSQPVAAVVVFSNDFGQSTGPAEAAVGAGRVERRAQEAPLLVGRSLEYDMPDTVPISSPRAVTTE